MHLASLLVVLFGLVWVFQKLWDFHTRQSGEKTHTHKKKTFGEWQVFRVNWFKLTGMERYGVFFAVI